MIEWCGLVFVISLRTRLIGYEVPPVNVECPHDFGFSHIRLLPGDVQPDGGVADPGGPGVRPLR